MTPVTPAASDVSEARGVGCGSARWRWASTMCKQEVSPQLPQMARPPAARDQPSPFGVSGVVCRACGIGLAASADATTVGGHHHHSFINPEGYIYRVRCFTKVRNVVTVGIPSSDFTWFAGHTWLVLACATCACHVGWQFDSESSKFFALIADRIAERDASQL